MNSKQRLRSWASEWTAYRTLAGKPASTPAPPDQGDASGGSSLYTVGGLGDVASMFLNRLNAAITPDDAGRIEQENLHNVSAFSQGQAAGCVPISPGQIRHLNPELKPAWSRPVYVFVLAVDDKRQRALAVPFGPLPVPAFDGELATGLDDESLAVLCLWNSAWMPLTLLAHSWPLMDAESELLRDAAQLRQALARKQTVPDSLLDRIGPPLVHPRDPRHDYVDAEEDLLEDLNSES
jgi:hypothetical protein